MGGTGLRATDVQAARGVAVGEYRPRRSEGAEIRSGSADYGFRAAGGATGVVAGHTLEGLIVVSERYTQGLGKRAPPWSRPHPFAYESAGEVAQFTNGLEPHPRCRRVFAFHRPGTLLRLQRSGPDQLCARLRETPDLSPGQTPGRAARGDPQPGSEEGHD